MRSPKFIFNPQPGWGSNGDLQHWEAEIFTAAPAPLFLSKAVTGLEKFLAEDRSVYKFFVFMDLEKAFDCVPHSVYTVVGNEEASHT